MAQDIQLSDLAYKRIRQFFFRHSGIDLPESKRHLVAGRLRSRVLSLGLGCYEAYFKLVSQPEQAQERQLMIDVLTTNETYFFREPQHFKLLAEQILPSLAGRKPRVWCAAASSGEEPYSLAMLLSDKLGLDGWELVASDLSTRTLARAKIGVYPMQRLELFPERYLKAYCRRGVGEYEGQMMIRPELRERVQLCQHNLLEPAGRLGQFDVIFLRNVLIYFNLETKGRVLKQLLQQLKPGGWLVIGHAESLHGLNTPLQPVRPSVFRLPSTGRVATGSHA
jgi:chemotaxis protein methyltransferase CheR